MKFATHATFGVLTGILYATTVNDINVAIASVGLAVLGSVLPDIDSKHSILTNILIFPKYLPLKHRGFMHSFTCAAILTAINVPLGLGAFSHIVLDLLNYKKIKLFAPFSQTKFALKICKSGGLADHALRTVCTGAIVLILLT